MINPQNKATVTTTISHKTRKRIRLLSIMNNKPNLSAVITWLVEKEINLNYDKYSEALKAIEQEGGDEADEA
jgi:hypothetical protein